MKSATTRKSSKSTSDTKTRSNTMLSIPITSKSATASRVIRHELHAQGPGEILLIMGRNGMGKTTLLKVLIGILPSKELHQAASRNSPACPPTSASAAAATFVPQGRMIFGTSHTVTENILTGARGSVPTASGEDLLPLPIPARHAPPHKGGNLSGGQQQQLAIARALISSHGCSSSTDTEGISPPSSRTSPAPSRDIRNLRKIGIIVSEQVVSFAVDVCDHCLRPGARPVRS